MAVPRLYHPAPDERPPYKRIADRLRREILTGTHHPGDQLPSASTLVLRFGVAPMTVRSAMRELRDEGLIYSVQGRGTFVRDPGVGGDIFASACLNPDAHQALCEEIEELRSRLSALEAAGRKGQLTGRHSSDALQ